MEPAIGPASGHGETPGARYATYTRKGVHIRRASDGVRFTSTYYGAAEHGADAGDGEVAEGEWGEFPIPSKEDVKLRIVQLRKEAIRQKYAGK